VPAIIQHYIPTFLQRRFGVDPENKKTKVFRLDMSSGSCRLANPRNEAAERRYYRLIDEDGNIDDSVEDLLSDIEHRGASVIRSHRGVAICANRPTQPPVAGHLRRHDEMQDAGRTRGPR
jgi:hypothetical protein